MAQETMLSYTVELKTLNHRQTKHEWFKGDDHQEQANRRLRKLLAANKANTEVKYKNFRTVTATKIGTEIAYK